MAKKGTKGQRLEKGESLYTPDLITRVKTIIMEIQPIKSNGSLHYDKVAKVMGIPIRTFSTWRSPESQYYKPLFVKALASAHEALVEMIESGRIKMGMIKRAQPYNRIKKTKELRTIGPDMPAMGSMKKAGLLAAAKKLGLKPDKKDTNDTIKQLITEYVNTHTEDVLIVVKQEEERMHGDVSAAKLVLPNIGPPEERWKDRSEVEVVGKSLTDILALMSGKKK